MCNEKVGGFSNLIQIILSAKIIYQVKELQIYTHFFPGENQLFL